MGERDKPTTKNSQANPPQKTAEFATESVHKRNLHVAAEGLRSARRRRHPLGPSSWDRYRSRQSRRAISSLSGGSMGNCMRRRESSLRLVTQQVLARAIRPRLLPVDVFHLARSALGPARMIHAVAKPRKRPRKLRPAKPCSTLQGVSMFGGQ
jgi:hypothetical protein